MRKENDILKDSLELKQMPFTVPEGYFEVFKEANARPVARKVSLWNRIAPYAAMAAVFVSLVTTGTFLLERSSIHFLQSQNKYDA